MTSSPGSWRRWCPLCAPRLDFRCQVSSGARVATPRTPPRAVRRALVAPMTLAAAPRTQLAARLRSRRRRARPPRTRRAAWPPTRTLGAERARTSCADRHRTRSHAAGRRRTRCDTAPSRARATHPRPIASAGTRRLAPRRSGAQERRVRQSTRWRCTAGSGAERASRSKQRKPTTSDAEAACSASPQSGHRCSSRATAGASARNRIRHVGQPRWCPALTPCPEPCAAPPLRRTEVAHQPARTRVGAHADAPHWSVASRSSSPCRAHSGRGCASPAREDPRGGRPRCSRCRGGWERARRQEEPPWRPAVPRSTRALAVQSLCARGLGARLGDAPVLGDPAQDRS